MPKRASGANSEPGQPLLPSINFAKCLTDQKTLSREPSRLNRILETELKSEVGGSAPCFACPLGNARGEVPPMSNTGVHRATRKRGASDGGPTPE